MDANSVALDIEYNKAVNLVYEELLIGRIINADYTGYFALLKENILDGSILKFPALVDSLNDALLKAENSDIVNMHFRFLTRLSNNNSVLFNANLTYQNLKSLLRSTVNAKVEEDINIDGLDSFSIILLFMAVNKDVIEAKLLEHIPSKSAKKDKG